MLDIFSPDFNHKLCYSVPVVTSSDFSDAVAELSKEMSLTRAHNLASLLAMARSTLPAVYLKLGLDGESSMLASQEVVDTALQGLTSPFKVSCNELLAAVELQDRATCNFAIKLLSNQMLGTLAQILDATTTLLAEYADDETMTAYTMLLATLDRVHEVATDNCSKFNVVPMFTNTTVEQAVIKMLSESK